jgi:hypothetical protein
MYIYIFFVLLAICGARVGRARHHRSGARRARRAAAPELTAATRAWAARGTTEVARAARAAPPPRIA